MAAQVRAGERQLVLSGEIDLASAPEIIALGEELLGSLRSGEVLVLDMAGVVFIDSTGLGALVSLRNTARQIGARLELRATPPMVLRVLELSGLKDSFEGC